MTQSYELVQKQSLSLDAPFSSSCMGLPFDMSLSPCVVQNKLVKHIDFLCEKIDALCIRRWQKVTIYQLYVCSSMSWLLGLLDLPLSWVERNIDTIITRFLKK